MQPRDERLKPPPSAVTQLSSMDNLLRALRSKVSADKCRLRDDSFDLDLTYITDRIIAMSFPADGYEKAYRNDVDEVAAFLQLKHHHRFLIFNLSERPYDYTKFDNQVQDWCGFPDHHAPPLALLFTVVRQMLAWLSVDPLNVVVVHCLAGKGRTGLVIACFLVFSGLFSTAEEALNFFALKRSTTNWGVTGPSQRRYAQYFSDILDKSLVPTVRPLRIRGVTLYTVPRFGLGFAGQGVCPVFEVWEVCAPRKRLLYTSERPDVEPRSYPVSMRSIHFALDCLVAADVYIVFKHVTSFYGTEIMLRFNFHTAMITSGELVLKRHEVDEADSDKRYAPEFSVTLQFADLSDEDRARFRPPVDYDPALWSPPDRRDPHVCWTGDAVEKIAQAREIASSKSKSAQRSGYLNKMGQQHKAWKRRWFVLKDGVLSYYIKPRDTTPKGRIPIESVWSVQPTDDPTMPFCFEIVTLKKTRLIASDSKQDVADWISSLLYARHVLLGGRPAHVGSVRVKIIEALELGPVPQDLQGFQCEVAVQEHKATTSVARPPVTWNQELVMPLSQEELNGEILLTMWLIRPGSPSTYYGEVRIPISSLQTEQGGVVKCYKLEKRRACTHPISGRLAVAFHLAVDLLPQEEKKTGSEDVDLRRSAPALPPPPSVSPRSASSTLPIAFSSAPAANSAPLPAPQGSPNPRTWILPQRSLPLPPLPSSPPPPSSSPAPQSTIISPTPLASSPSASSNASSNSPSPTLPIAPPPVSFQLTTTTTSHTGSYSSHITQSVSATSPLASLLPSPAPPPSDPMSSAQPVRQPSLGTDSALSVLEALSEEMPRLAAVVRERNHLENIDADAEKTTLAEKKDSAARQWHLPARASNSGTGASSPILGRNSPLVNP